MKKDGGDFDFGGNLGGIWWKCMGGILNFGENFMKQS